RRALAQEERVMKLHWSSCLFAALTCACASSVRTSVAPAPSENELDTARIEEITGLKGTLNASEHVFKVTSPRTDVSVSVDGRTLEPFMGLTSWVGFTPGKKVPCMAMGDLVLFQDEVSSVMSAALDNGLAVTALHNHFL